MADPKLCPIMMATRQNNLQHCRQDKCAWWIKNRLACAIEFICCIEGIQGG